ncbi:MAG TPA: LysM peptidoglycan-binding domain-containing protein [Candidatus Tripitaka sp. YC43]
MNRKSFIRRVEVQIGIILGVVMFSILGVFLGIRKGEQKPHEAAVVTKVADETSEMLNQKALEQAQAEAQPKEGTVGAPLAHGASTPHMGIPPGAAEAPVAPTAEMPAAGEQGQAVTKTVSLPTTHTVKANDTLIALARRYYGDDSKWTLISEANRLAGQRNLVVGQKLTIPTPKEVSASTAGGQAAKAEKPPVKVSAAKANRTSSGRAHRAQQGDTLYKLARTYYGDESQWKKIYNANHDVFSQRETVEPGDVLIIP